MKRRINRPRQFATLLAGVLLSLGLVTGCHRDPAAAPKAPPVEVAVVPVARETVPVVTELPGRLEAYRVAEVRARATGILLKRCFEEGTNVAEGQVLFQIDPAPLEASYHSAQAALARVEANAIQARAKAKRFELLSRAHAVSEQDFENATAIAAQAEADIQEAQAAVETARLNLGYATVTAPISGRIGAAKVTEGALVSQTEATPLAIIQQLDPIYFDFSESSTEVLRLRRAFDEDKLVNVSADSARTSLLLEDGSEYARPGRLLFSDISVDPSTGMVLLRALFPNPDHLLLPGMFARGRIEQAVDTRAITVPQRAVTRGAGGDAWVLVVGSDDVVEQRPVSTGTAIGDRWIVTGGLKEGERIIVAGLQKVRPGAVVKPVPFEAGPGKGAPSGATANASAPTNSAAPASAGRSASRTR